MPDPDKLLLDVEELEAVGFVDAGANPDSDIMIWKRKKENAVDADNADTRNMLQKIYDAVTKNQTVPATAGEDNTDEGEGKMPFDKNELPEAAREHIAALEAQVAELQTAAPDSEPEGEPDVVKSLPDDQREAIEKRLAAQEAEIAKAREEAKQAREEAAIEKRERRMEVFRKQAAESLVAIKGENDEIAEMLFAVEENLPEDMAKRVTDALETASAQLSSNSKLVAEIGKHGGDAGPDSATGQIEKAAAAVREAKPGLTIEQARTEVMTDPANAALVEAYRRERQ